MINMSQVYKDSMRQGMRNESFIRISFGVVDPDAAGSVELTDNGHEPFSDLANTNAGELPTQTYVTFEKGRYKIGRGQIIYSNDVGVVQGYVSNAVADEAGYFAINPVIEITSALYHSTLGLTFIFDGLVKESPRQIRMAAYRDETAVYDKVHVVGRYDYSVEAPMEQWNRLVIEFIQVLPYHRARIDSLIFGVTKTFENDLVISSTHTMQVNPLALSLTKNTFDFTIENFGQLYNPDNPQGVYPYIEEQQPIKVEYGYDVTGIGDVEWLLGGNYVLDGAPVINENDVQFKAVDILGNLTGIYYKGLYRPAGISLYDLALLVLQDAGVDKYKIDPHLQSIYTKAPLPLVAHKECLQIIANAGQCILFTNRSGEIEFRVALDPTITIHDNGHTEFSDVENAYNSLEIPETTYITFEKSFWTVSSSQKILSEPYEDQGYVSSHLAGTGGIFAVNPKIYINYSSRTSSFEIPLWFGGKVYDFNVNYYNGSTLLHSLEVRGNESLEYTVLYDISGFNRIEIEIVRVKPYQRARIKKIGSGRINDYYLDFNNSLAVPVVKKQEPLYAVDVKMFGYLKETEAAELFNETFPVMGQVIFKIEYEAACDFVVTCSVGTYQADLYTRFAVVTVQANEDVTLLITGRKLIESSTIISHVVGQKGEVKTLANPLITDVANASSTAIWVADWLLKRNEYEVSYRGSPELDPYDLIYAQSKFEEYFPVRITKNVINFNGAIRGQMTVRRS